MNDRLHSLMVAHGALVFIVGLLAGFPFAFLLLGKITLWPIPGSIDVSMPGDVRGWRMAHLEGILNGLTLFAIAAVATRLQLTLRAQRRIAWSLILTAWGNIVAAIVGPIFGGRGLAFGDGAANSVMYLLFVAAIVAVLVAMVQVLIAALRGATR
jgi:hypothetical protein